MTRLEPRTQHQPGKLQKLSKNDAVLRSPKKKSTVFVQVYLLCFQWSAGCPQGYAEKWCRRRRERRVESRAGCAIGGFAQGGSRMFGAPDENANVKKPAETALEAGFANVAPLDSARGRLRRADVGVPSKNRVIGWPLRDAKIQQLTPGNPGLSG